MEDLERYAWEIAIQSGQAYGTTLNAVRRLATGKGQEVSYKNVDARLKAPTNRQQKRRFMRMLGVSKGATKKRAASLKVVR